MLPPAAVSLDEAHAAIELWEFYKGRTLDGTQRLTVEVMMATGADGRWAAQTTGREMPRQNGKGDEIEVPEFWGMVQRAEAILHTVHDAVLLATQTHQRMLSLFEGHKDLRRLLARVWKGTGQQMIELTNGGVIWYRTRSDGGAGRGLDMIDRLVVDESQHCKEEHLSDSSPTLGANDNPQMNVLGTAGIEGKSAWWWGYRIRALSDNPGDFGYVGHTAESVHLDANGKVVQAPIDPADQALWIDANPGLVGAGRGGGVKFLAEQYRRIPTKFAREHLGVWDPPPLEEQADVAIDPARFRKLVDGQSEVADDKAVRLALDAPPSLVSASFGIAGLRADGLLHCDQRLFVEPSKMGQLVALAKQLTDGHGTPIVVPPNSPALAWKAKMLEAGVELDVLTPAEYAQACGAMKVAVAEASFRHRAQPEMIAAIDGLSVRSSGDVDVWSRRNSSVNIAPFVAATCALVRVPQVVESAYAGGLSDLEDFLPDDEEE